MRCPCHADTMRPPCHADTMRRPCHAHTMRHPCRAHTTRPPCQTATNIPAPILPSPCLVPHGLLNSEDILLADPTLPQNFPRIEVVLYAVRLPACVVWAVCEVSLSDVSLEDAQVTPTLVVLNKKRRHCVTAVITLWLIATMCTLLLYSISVA